MSLIADNFSQKSYYCVLVALPSPATHPAMLRQSLQCVSKFSPKRIKDQSRNNFCTFGF